MISIFKFFSKEKLFITSMMSLSAFILNFFRTEIEIGDMLSFVLLVFNSLLLWLKLAKFKFILLFIGRALYWNLFFSWFVFIKVAISGMSFIISLLFIIFSILLFTLLLMLLFMLFKILIFNFVGLNSIASFARASLKQHYLINMILWFIFSYLIYNSHFYFIVVTLIVINFYSKIFEKI